MGNYTKNLRTRVSTKGSTHGYCAICKESATLSRDHVPPRCCGNIDTHILEFLHSGKPTVSTQSQGGTHFRTICSKCNGDRLGLLYDPALGEMTNEVKFYAQKAYEGSISLPDTIQVKVQPQKIARSIIGHLMAAVATDEIKEPDCSSPVNQILRNYFLNQDSPLPDEAEIYYWIYPGKKQTVLKHFAKQESFGGKLIFGSCLKFPPLGFCITHNSPELQHLGVRKLLKNKDLQLDQEVNININLYEVPPLDFPEKPGERGMVMLANQLGYEALPKEF